MPLDGPTLETCSEPERRLFNEVLKPALAESALRFVQAQREILDSNGRRRRLDFAVETGTTRLAIELDGYSYHAEGAISRSAFDDQLTRQNELIIEGWKVLRFSWDQVVREPERCQDAFRRALVADPELHPSFSPSSLKPHLIQQEALAALELSRRDGHVRGLVVLATGLGKTFLSAFDACRVGGRILFIVHNNGILGQAQAAFQRVAPEKTTGFFHGTQKSPDADVVFANIATLRSHLHSRVFGVGDFDYIIVDEFHHAAARSYEQVFSYFRPKFLLGMTATPDRTDKKAILHLVHDNLVYELSQAAAIRRGFLVPFEYFALRDDIDYTRIRHNGFRYDVEDLNKALVIERRDDSIVEQYRQLANDEKAIAFCVTIDHADRAAEHFRGHGIAATSIHSRLDGEERARRLAGFRTGEHRVACVRDLFNEGMDVPDLGALLFMRPTESKVIFIQQLGRGLRLCAGKRAVRVLDFIGNYVNAERITDYLTEMGTPVSLDDLKEKPVLHFDTGCAVSFQAEVIDTILHLDQKAVTGEALVQGYFGLQQRLGRQPTTSDLVASGGFRLRQYIACYGTWGDFVARLRKLAPEQEFSGIEWPEVLRDASVDRLTSLCDPDSEDFRDLLDESALQLEALFNAFALAGAAPRAGRNKMEQRAQGLAGICSALNYAASVMKQVTIVLDLSTTERVEPATSDREPNPEIVKVADRVAKQLELLSTSREVLVFSRKFTSLEPIASAYQRSIKRLGTRSADSRLLRSRAYAIARHLATLQDMASRVARLAE